MSLTWLNVADVRPYAATNLPVRATIIRPAQAARAYQVNGTFERSWNVAPLSADLAIHRPAMVVLVVACLKSCTTMLPLSSTISMASRRSSASVSTV